jgi:putative sigma-54 modulation protein
MNLNIKATKTTLTPSLQADIENKFSVLEDFLRDEDQLYVEVEARASKDNSQEFRAEVSIKPAGHYAEASGSDVYEAIDLLLPKIRQQLSRKKDKEVSLRRKLGNAFKRVWSREK